uniref:Cyclic nucleotide-binding domain-containing protein n=1 Tax=Opuntia streptacantha TaxID=393608 RepID=A0A7C9A8Y1_OPUST
MYLIREGDPVTEILFVIWVNLDSCTTDVGCSGFFSSSQTTAGGLCGEELLIWSLNPHSTDSLPLSSRTVKALSDVETFCLSAENMRFIVLQFPTQHSTKLRHRVKFYYGGHGQRATSKQLGGVTDEGRSWLSHLLLLQWILLM